MTQTSTAPTCPTLAYLCRDLLAEALGREAAEEVLAAAEAAEARHLAAVLVRSACAAAIAQAEVEAAHAAAAAVKMQVGSVQAARAPAPHYQRGPMPAAAPGAAAAGPAAEKGTELPGGNLPPWLLDHKGVAAVKLQANPGITKVQLRPQAAAAVVAGAAARGEAPAEDDAAPPHGGAGEPQQAERAAEAAATVAPAEPTEAELEEQRKAERRRCGRGGAC